MSVGPHRTSDFCIYYNLIFNAQNFLKSALSIKNPPFIMHGLIRGLATGKGGDGWYRELFYNHPTRADGSHMHGRTSGKRKVYCKKCFDLALSALEEGDNMAVSTGALVQARDKDVLIDLCMLIYTACTCHGISDINMIMYTRCFILVWATATSQQAISSASSTAINHLAACPYQPPSVRNKALEHKSKLSNAPKNLRSVSAGPRLSSTTVPQMGNYNAAPGPSHLGSYHYSSPYITSTPQLPLVNTHFLPPQISLQSVDQPAYHSTPDLRSHPYHLGTRSEASGSRESLLSPSDSISSAGLRPPLNSQLFLSSQPASPHPGALPSPSGYTSVPLSPLMQPEQVYIQKWPDARRKQFEKRILRLTASAGLPLSWVENLEWKRFCDEFMPGSPRISRKVLTRRILREVVAEFRAEVCRKCKGKEVTLQADGWTGLNNHHLVAFMITSDNKVLHFYFTFGVHFLIISSMRCTLYKLITQLKSDILRRCFWHSLRRSTQNLATSGKSLWLDWSQTHQAIHARHGVYFHGNTQR